MFKAGVDKSKIVECLRRKLQDAWLHSYLTIIDPYFFSGGEFGDAHDTIYEVLSPFEHSLRRLEVVTSERNYNKANHKILDKKLDFLRIEVLHNKNFHDRFWIIEGAKAFVVGTSINGFGKKHFYVQDDFLSDRDTQSILSFYKQP